ncbi:MAG TPA: c-type cytochrome [Casimicrobiaceae bacterium]|jgi:cytochrome c oxidase cbb3-type subunit 3
MCSACRNVLVLMMSFAAACCEREARTFAHPGEKEPESRYEQNSFALSEGKRLYAWYNCDGCHAQGGGDKGPALMDDAWIYGSAPANIFQSIVEGRPNGMPSFGGRIPEQQVWEIVAYVRSMSGLVSQQAAPNRADAIHAKKPESNVDPQTPANVSTPKP